MIAIHFDIQPRCDYDDQTEEQFMEQVYRYLSYTLGCLAHNILPKDFGDTPSGYHNSIAAAKYILFRIRTWEDHRIIRISRIGPNRFVIHLVAEYYDSVKCLTKRA